MLSEKVFQVMISASDIVDSKIIDQPVVEITFRQDIASVMGKIVKFYGPPDDYLIGIPVQNIDGVKENPRAPFCINLEDIVMISVVEHPFHDEF